MSTNSPHTLTATSLTLRLRQIDILQDVSLTLRPGELLGLIGPNGAGKSSLLKTLAGLQTPTTGSVMLDNQDLFTLKMTDRAKTIGYLAQHAEIHWPLEVKRLITLGRIPHHPHWQSLNASDKLAIDQAMQLTEVTHLAHRTINHLSGGERLRVMLARVLAGEPRLILADEPIANLDPYHQLHTMEILKEHCLNGGSAIIVMHDLNLAARFCDKLLLLDHGRPISYGPPAEVLTPNNLATTFHVLSRLSLAEQRPSLEIIARMPPPTL